MEKKKKPIEDEVLDQVTGGDGSYPPDFEELFCKKGNHLWEDLGDCFRCKVCKTRGDKFNLGI